MGAIILLNAGWIECQNGTTDNCPLFRKKFSISKAVASATVCISARGVYEAHLNGKRVGDFILAPGWTSYKSRIQYQEYDITGLLSKENTFVVQVAPGWYNGRIASWSNDLKKNICAVIAKIRIVYTDGAYDTYYTDTDWKAAKSGLLFCDIFDGFIFDARIVPDFNLKTVISENNDRSLLVPQIGEKIKEHERLKPINVIRTINGETILDFGQNLAGYVEIKLSARTGDKVSLSFAEILDKDGNFYNENYRSAKCQYVYICRDGEQEIKPTLTFYGFRYVKIDEYPCEIKPESFTAIAVYSDMKRTGNIETSDKLLNKLYSNIIWGQRSNFIDVPTDCPQRDERMGWTGDAQVFVRTASYNYNVEKFFFKWLGDMATDQSDNGAVPIVVPKQTWANSISAAWADAITICPWQIYLTYGNKNILEKMFQPMTKWVDYITNSTEKPGLWIGGKQHFGDWLGLDAPYGSYKGASREDFIASSFYAKSTELVCKAGRVIGKDVTDYEKLYDNIVAGFRKEYSGDYRTQTEYAMALYFGLTTNPQETAKELIRLINNDGNKLQTGFVGTPYILHALSKYGYNELAYTLLLRKEYPSWLYPVTKGATTMWEHWDGIMPDGKLWPSDMNSFNHYAYGAVGDWLYGVCGGINTVEEYPGFERVHFAPVSDKRIEWFKAEVETAYGTVKSGWRHENGMTFYEITTPVKATALINGIFYHLKAGVYTFKA